MSQLTTWRLCRQLRHILSRVSPASLPATTPQPAGWQPEALNYWFFWFFWYTIAFFVFFFGFFWYLSSKIDFQV